MRALLTTIGSHGDLFPMLAIGRALETRGVACEIATHPLFAPDVEAAGIGFLPILQGFPVAETLRHPDLFHPVRGLRLGSRIIRPLMQSFVDDFRPLVERDRPDVIVAHYAGAPARWIARESSVPCAMVVLAPTAWHAADDPVPSHQLVPGPGSRSFARFFEKVVDPAVQFLLGRWVDDFHERAGFAERWTDSLPKSERRDPRGAPSVWDEFRAGDLNLGMWDAAFRPPLAGDPERGVICGFPWLDQASDALDIELERFLDAGEAPIVFTLGSAAVHHPGDFYSLAVEACNRLGRRGVLLTGGSIPEPGLFPATVIAPAWAPHAKLFPRALVNVHHAGIGTTAQCVRAGRPSVAVPHAFDQFNNALRVHALGTGLVVPRYRLTLGRLVAALDQAIQDEVMAERARALGARIRINGADTAAAAIERLVAGEKRSAA